MKWIIICLLSFLLVSCSDNDNSSNNISFECNLFSLSVLCYLFVEILVGIPQYGQYVTV